MSNEKQGRNPRRFIFQLVALSLILVGLPLGSWYYLQKGYNYRLEILNDLSDLGVVGGYAFVPFEKESFALADLKGSVVVTSFLDRLDSPYAVEIGENLNKLVDQFGKTDKVHFLINTNDRTNIEQYHEKYLQNNPYCTFLQVGEAQLQNIKVKSYHCTGQQMDFVVVDPTLNVRNCYVNSPEDMKRLVEHVSVLTPRKGTEDPVVKRETEK